MGLRSAPWGAPLVFATVLWAGPVHAQDADLDRARALFVEAGEEERAGRWAAAQERLRAAIRIHETPHLRYALGWALENEGRTEEAKSEYRTALELANSANNAEVRGLAQGRLDALERKRDVATAPTKTSPHQEKSLVVPWLLVGSGAVLGITGIALFASSSSDASSRDDARRRWCDATACSETGAATVPETPEARGYRDEAVRAADRGNEKQLVGGICIGVGLVGAAVGAILLLRDDSKRGDARPRTSVGASPTPGGASVGALLTF